MNYLITIFLIINQIIIINSVKLNRDELGEIFLENLYENLNENVLAAEIQPTDKYNLDMHFDDFLINLELFGSKIKRNGEKIRKKRLISNLVHVNHDEGVYMLDGFKEIASIPIDFPKDLCLFQVNDSLFAAGLTQNLTDQKIYLQFFKQKNGQYVLIDEYQTISATEMDCISRENKAYVAVVNIKTNETEIDPPTGSPIFEITETSIHIVQMLRSINLKSIRLWTYGNDMYLIKAFNSKSKSKNTSNLVENQLCLVYKWMGFHFDIIDELPCNHPMHIEPFIIRTDIFIAIADYMDDYGSTDTFSYIYKYDFDTDKFYLMQKLKSRGAIDLKYFHLETENNHYEHFLIIANSVDVNHDHKNEPNYETQSVIYKFVHGSFIPSQQLQFYKIRKFLPVVGKHNEFSLLVACENQEVQVYQYDGWKFTKSVSYSTGDVFGKGITNMRSIVVKDANLIVIANENLNTDYNNIFEPIYTFKNDLNLLQKEVMAWCESSYKIVENYEVEQYLRLIEKLPTTNDELFIKGIEFHNATISNIITKTITTPTAKLDTEFFNNVSRIHTKTNYLKTKLHIFTDVKGVSQLGILSSSTNENENLDQGIKPIDEMVLDDLSKIEKLNGYYANSLLLTTGELKFNNLVLKNDSYAGRGLIVENKIDSIKFNSSNVLLKHGPQVFTGQLRIENLYVDKLRTKLINDFPLVNPTNVESFELELNNTLKKKLVVKKLTVHGLINGWNTQFLYDNSLKVNENQVITESYLIGYLSGDNLRCSQLISGNNLSDLIPIDHGNFKIQQDIQFTDGVEINNLLVTQRINNIKVIDGQLDVLLIDSPEKQVMYGEKIYENVNLLEPIVLHGKIKSKNFENINPIVTVDNSLVLQGDYYIYGDVTIRKGLRSFDVYGQSRTHGINYLQERGLLLSSTSSNLKFNFTQAIRTNNLNIELINERYRPNEFIKLDSNEMQVITGPVVIKNDLYIDGLCEVSTINNIDITLLNSTILRRTGDQIIEGTIHIDEIIVDHCNSDRVTIGTEHKLDDYLYFAPQAVSQTIPFEITINGQLNVTHALTIDHLTTNSKINGYDINHLIEDTAQRNRSLTVTGDKYFETDVIIEYLGSKGTVFGIHLNEMENNFDDSQEIVYNGNAIFTGNQTWIDKLVVFGYINGVHSTDFGENWLLSEYDQNISAKITVDELVFQDDVVITGKLNKHDLQHIVENCLMIDRAEQINSAVFKDGIISLNNTEIHGLIGGVNVSDIILSESATVQKIMNGLIMEQGLLHVENYIFIDNTLNNLAIKDLKAFITPEKYNILTEGVVINGSCTFPSEPNIEILNGHSIDKLYHYSWMLNEGKVITVPVSFENVEFHDDIKLNGLLNGKNLTILAVNYFSLNYPQDISSQFIVTGSALTNSKVNLVDVMLDGELRTHNSEKSINIDHYDKFALKRDSEQIITGEWILDEVYLYDVLPDIPINGYKIPEDIVFEENAMINITSKKTFHNINSYGLICPDPCIIQDVNVIDWINQAVDRFDINTIEGLLTIDNVQIETLSTDASIQNIDFYPDKIFTKSTEQIINGTLTIATLGDNASDVFIENLYTSEINGLPLEFLNNIALDTEDRISINNKIVFIEPITVINTLHLRGKIFGVEVSDLTRHNKQFLEDLDKLNDHINFYDKIANKLQMSFNDQAYYIQYFIHRQTITGEIVKIISISVIYNQNYDKRDYIAILEIQNKWPIIYFYRYSAESKAIIRDDDISPITFNDSKIIDISWVHFTNIDMLYIESTHQKSIKHYLLAQNIKGFQLVHEFVNEMSLKVVSFKLSKRDCLLFYSADKDSSISCVELVHNLWRLDFYQNLENIRTKHAISIENNIYVSLALLTVDGRVEVWIEDLHQKLTIYQIIDVSDPISITGISFKQFNYIAIASASLNSTIYIGSIEIYRAPQNGSFYHFQTINIKLPKTIEFSILQNGDLLLYAITDDPISPLNIYEYAGIMGFRSYAHGARLPRGDTLALYKVREMKKDYIIIKSHDRALFVEVVMNKNVD